MGLPSIHRLKHWREFRAVYRKGIRSYGSSLILRALFIPQTGTQSQLKPSRIGISISTKVSKKAVRRNLIKRRIRAAMQELLPRIDDGWHIVIVVKDRATECKYVDFLRELEQLLIKSNIINGY